MSLAISIARFLVLAVAVAACSTPSGDQRIPSFTAGEGPLLRSQSIWIQRATVPLGGRTITIEFIGGEAGDVLADPCHVDYELEIDEQASPMRVTVWNLAPTVRPEPIGLPEGVSAFGCTGVGHSWKLNFDVSGRVPSEIVDGASGATLPVIAVGSLLSPGALPGGWEISESGAPPEPNATTVRLSDGEDFVFVRATLQVDPASALEPFRSGPSAGQPDEGVAIREVTMRGDNVGVVEVTDEVHRLRFVEQTHLYEISATAGVPVDILLAIAEGLT